MKKCALLIGINYNGTASKLNGCINDVINMKRYLLSENEKSVFIDLYLPLTILT